MRSSLTERFERQARLNGDRLAVRAGHRTLTYTELNSEANRLARAFLRETTPPEPGRRDRGGTAAPGHEAGPIPICMGQGLEAIVATLGLLKAGRAYVPIDPTDPRARVEFILEDIGARTVVTDSEGREVVERSLPDGCDVFNVDLGVDAAARRAPPSSSTIPAETVEPAASHRSPAYVMYTSGSTRRPKGAVHTHESFLHNVMCLTTVLRISQSDRLSLLAWATGQANSNIFSALLNGASLHLWNTKRDGLPGLARWLQDSRITVCSISAPIYRSFLDLLDGEEEFPELRVVRLASDKVYPDDFLRFRKHFSDRCFFVNAFSSSETGLICANVMTRSTPMSGGSVPIGYPVADTEVELVDEHGAPVGAGQVGAIAVRSRYLTRGYWGRRDLSEAVIEADPDDAEVQTYRSEDLARWRPDGVLEHVGRKGSVVKIRGYRVETTEVESATPGA